jgi:hypothetical protein
VLSLAAECGDVGDADGGVDTGAENGTGGDTDTGAPFTDDSGPGEDADEGTDETADCSAVMSESYYCITLTDSHLAYLGLDTGTVCPIVATDYVDCASTAWIGDSVYFCDQSTLGRIVRVSTVDGSTEEVAAPCRAVAALEGGLRVMAELQDPWFMNKLFFFETFEDLAANNGTMISPVNYYASRMTVQGGVLYTAWHSTNEIDVFTPPWTAGHTTISLENYDTWVMGMSVTDDGLLVLNASWPENRVVVFDVATGEELWEVAVSGLRGLSCVPGI